MLLLDHNDGDLLGVGSGGIELALGENLSTEGRES